EVRRIIDEAYDRAKAILTTHRTKLDQIAGYLVQHEVVEGEALEALFTSPPPPPALAGVASAS
ncbi:MAG: hypothetical protein NTZ05_05245, partial [Chloroflexi bacterium]|nr:hypothetical protein [Chloroflexota bacterium]